MLITVEGVYKNGRVELSEKSENMIEGKVLVVFLEQPPVVSEAIIVAQDDQEEEGKGWLSRIKSGAGVAASGVGAITLNSGQIIANTASGAYGAVGNAASHIYGKATDTSAALSRHTFPLLSGLTTQAGNAVELVTDNATIRQLAQNFNLEHWLDVSEHIDIEKAQEVVQELKAKYPNEEPREIAHRLIMQKAIYAGGVGLSTSILPGAAIAFLAVDLAATALLQAELVFQIAAAYDLNLEDPSRKGEILAVFGCVLGANRVAKVGLGFVKNAPVVGAVIGATSNAAMIYALGHAACTFYEKNLHLEASQEGIKELKEQNESYLEEVTAQEILADQILVHIVLAGNPDTSKADIISALQTANLSPASLEVISARLDKAQPLDDLLEKLQPDFAAYVLSQCQRIADLDDVVTKEEAAVIEQITRRFAADSTFL